MKNGLLTSDIISLKVLSSITVRISCYNHVHGEEIGTGIIIKDQGQFYVLTAAHCLVAPDKYEFSNSEINIESVWGDTSMPYTLLGKVAQDCDSDKDFAILKISEPTGCSFDFDHDLFMIRNISNKISATTYGFSKGAGHKGRSYDLELTGSQKWSVKENIKEKGEDPYDVMRGLSGAGLFIKFGGKYLCVGYVKGLDEDNNILQDITVFPMSHFDYNWTMNWYDCLEKAEEKLNALEHITTPKAPLTQLTNKAKIHYDNLWIELYSAIYNKKEITSLIKSIEDGKKLYPVSKNTRSQEMVINYLYRKKDNWSEDEQQSFLMALLDRGVWPSLYGKLPKQAAGVENKPLFKKMEKRGKTLLAPNPCEMPHFADFDDTLKYEEILRAAFSFNFGLMYTMVSLWQPSRQWVIKKTVLKNIFGKSKENCQQLHDYIQSERIDFERKYLAIQAYNLIDIKFPEEYDSSEYHKAGLDSFVTIANSIIDKIGKKQEKIKPYGVHYMQIIDNEDVTSFPESLHLLSALIETGLTTNNFIMGIISSERWYKVCCQLIDFCPLPILYYTLQYQDNKLLKKVGQYLAYRYDKQNPHLLTRLLKTLLNALTDKYLPRSMYSSIYQLTRELYVAVDEEEWYSLVYSNIICFFCKNDDFYEVTTSDEIYLNVQAAILCLKVKEHEQKIFSLLLDCFERNRTIVNVLINDVLDIQPGFFDSVELKQIKVNFINKTFLCDGYCVFYKLLKSGNLEDNDMVVINQKAQQESMNFAKGNLSTLGMLLELITDREIIGKLKQILLNQDMWHCGVRRENSTFSLPNSSHLEKLPVKVTWEKDEWGIIIQNMYDNLSLLNMDKTKELADSYFRSEYLKLIYEMKCFLVNQKEAHKMVEPELEKMLDTTLAEKRGYTQLYEALISENYSRLSEGCRHLCTLVKTQGIKDFEDEIDLLIYRVILKRKVAITFCLSAVNQLLSFYKKEMVKNMETN